eukprot:COSAG01_NODE_199_length_22202_cov_23.993668_20_plen_80_part_00
MGIVGADKLWTVWRWLRRNTDKTTTHTLHTSYMYSCTTYLQPTTTLCAACYPRCRSSRLPIPSRCDGGLGGGCGCTIAL